MSRKRCTHCGMTFEARFENAKLCLPCWQKRERALEEYDHLRAENRRLESALWAEQMRAKLEREARQRAPIPTDILRDLIRLAHPDKHANSAASNRCTAWLLSQRQQA